MNVLHVCKYMLYVSKLSLLILKKLRLESGKGKPSVELVLITMQKFLLHWEGAWVEPHLKSPCLRSYWC